MPRALRRPATPDSPATGGSSTRCTRQEVLDELTTTAAGATEAAPPGSSWSIVTGMSGAGRSTAAKCLEDLGWFVVDNLPPELIADHGRPGQPHVAAAVTRIAVVVDVRSRAFFADLRGRHRRARRSGGTVPRVLFLEAVRRRAGAPVRERPPAAPAAGRRPAGRRHRARAGAAARPARRGRPGHRHQPTCPCTSCAARSSRVRRRGDAARCGPP